MPEGIVSEVVSMLVKSKIKNVISISISIEILSFFCPLRWFVFIFGTTLNLFNAPIIRIIETNNILIDNTLP